MILNHYLSLVIIVFTSRALTLQNECDATDKTIEYMCKTLAHYFKHDNGNLAKYKCGCLATLFTGDYNYCKADEYDFLDAPACALVYRSTEFKEASNGRPSKFSKYFTEIIGRNFYNVCDEPNEDIIVNTIIGVYENQVIISATEAAVRYGYDYDLARSINLCYREIQRLAKDRIENLLTPPHLFDEWNKETK